MLRFVIRRIALMIPVLLGLTLLLFVWIRSLPGDPARALLGERATAERVAEVNQRYGFDKPIIVQYGAYLKQLLSGDFGSSIKTGGPIAALAWSSLPLSRIACRSSASVGLFAAKYASKLLNAHTRLIANGAGASFTSFTVT